MTVSWDIICILIALNLCAIALGGRRTVVSAHNFFVRDD